MCLGKEPACYSKQPTAVPTTPLALSLNGYGVWRGHWMCCNTTVICCNLPLPQNVSVRCWQGHQTPRLVDSSTYMCSRTTCAMVYLQCVLYVCVCHRSQFKLGGCVCIVCVCVCHRSPVQVGVFVCVLYVCMCVCVCRRSPVQVGVFVCLLYVCVCSTDCCSPQHTARGCYTWFISEFHITSTSSPRPLSAVSPMVTKIRTHLLTPLL